MATSNRLRNPQIHSIVRTLGVSWDSTRLSTRLLHPLTMPKFLSCGFTW
jgi:hypothetical protein